MRVCVCVCKSRLRWHGAPRLSAAWKDESDNRLLKAIAAAAHSGVFHPRVLSTWDMHTNGTKNRRKRKARFVTCVPRNIQE